ncbi:hypothetical protein [Rhodococcoides yunnanense]|uniref:hypothetical protein n=1 Tax=Rhodococcoides yunnanense TaxID=278209 RepID=UPI0009341955|nr:hypothetical protein [Rhodococcus yunnanensis]
MDGVEIDVEAAGNVADAFVGVAAAVRAAADRASRLGFGSESAGRNYGDVGGRLGEGYARVPVSLRRWAEGLDENAAQLRASVDGYRGTDGSVAESIATRAGGHR